MAPTVREGARSTPRPASGAAEARQRADAATEALVEHFWSGDARGFVASFDGAAPAEYWVSAQALDAVLDGVERTGGRRWADIPRAFIAAQDARGWRRRWFDDEGWMALALIRASDITGDRGALARADALMDDIQANAPDDSCCGTVPGGLWWDRDHTQKATAANAGAVITAAELYLRRHDPSRLAFARKVFDYWFAQMVDPRTGQVADHVDAAGNKVWWRYTYNEGTMIGAAVALYHATGEGAYLDAARRVGAHVLSGQTADSAAGRILTDGASCRGDCEQFKGIAQRYLAALAGADPAGAWGALVHSDATAIWDLARDPATTTFGVDWAGPPRPATISTQSSATMALDRAARAAGDRTAGRDPGP
jgi:predicted alpha-1,6-mannanase (GH76 family)